MSIQNALLKLKADAAARYAKEHGHTAGFDSFWKAIEPDLLQTASRITQLHEAAQANASATQDAQAQDQAARSRFLASDADKAAFVREYGVQAFQERMREQAVELARARGQQPAVQ